MSLNPELSRRRFLQTAALATTAATLAPSLTAQPEPTAIPYPENGTLIPDDGWHLWIDQKAPWQDDDIYLPEDISWVKQKLCAKGEPLPVNAPTGGWQSLTPTTGLEVILPSTVEQHFWGKFGSRPYTPEEYRYAADTKGGKQPATAPADDDIPLNGAYFGVSWWHRPIDIPAAMQGKRIFLHIRGAHLRAEVYLNHQLVGYSIMEELPFECDLTHAANPGGENHLAIRITNPFGRYDWVDGNIAKWHNVSLYRSHGFGGLDRGITLSAHASVRITDLWVLNTPDPTTIVAMADVTTRFNQAGQHVVMEVIDPTDGSVVATNASAGFAASIPSTPGTPPDKPYTMRSKVPLQVKSAKIWDFATPTLYHLRATISHPDFTETRTIAFGFRSFTTEGVGVIDSTSAATKPPALFRLNGRRIRLYSSISWGFWGLNGMFPVPELALKEVTAAKALGLNCLNFHRNLAKEDVLRHHDQLGLLRYMEPGAGRLATGKLPTPGKPTSDADLFGQRYAFARCVHMVRAHRSHPSVIEYCLQNELSADLKNPGTLAVLKAMHDEDPSRMVVLNDGFVARDAAQAWYEPWSNDLKEGHIHRSDVEKYGGFWNNHQGAGDQWFDRFYKSPTEYTYRAPYREILTEYGEMEGCARPDVHGLDIHQITDTYKRYGGTSYDLADHEAILAGYNDFLTKWGFRNAFPTPDHVFLAVGRTCYESWANYLENARISDDLDFAVVSGWESTAIENHSGIVDNLRNFKSDPKLLGDTLQPIRPIAKQRALAIKIGQPATFDLYLANDTSTPATGTLTFSMVTPSGIKSDLITLPAPTQSPDVFSYLLKEGFQTPPLVHEGLYRFKFEISSSPLSTQTKELWATSCPPLQIPPTIRIGVSGISPETRKLLNGFRQTACLFLEISNFVPGTHYDLILTSGLTATTSTTQSAGETTGEQMPTSVQGAPQTSTQLGHIDPAILETVRTGTPLFVLPQADTLSDGCAQQLAAAGAFTYHGAVGDFRAPWMGNWYFGRQHPLFEGLPTDAALGGFYQVEGRKSNGLVIDRALGGPEIEIVIAYSRDHDRKVGAGTFTTKLGKGKILYHRTPDFHPVLQQRFLANALRWLTA